MVPPEIDGVRTDIIEVGDLWAFQTPRGRFRPTPPGVSVSHYQSPAGTFGCVVRDRQFGTRLILSNNHVLAKNNEARLGDPILQPSPTDGGQDNQDILAYLVRIHPLLFAGNDKQVSKAAKGFVGLGNFLSRLFGSQINFSAAKKKPDQVNYIDAALARPADDSAILDEIQEHWQSQPDHPCPSGYARSQIWPYNRPHHRHGQSAGRHHHDQLLQWLPGALRKTDHHHAHVTGRRLRLSAGGWQRPPGSRTALRRLGASHHAQPHPARAGQPESRLMTTTPSDPGRTIPCYGTGAPIMQTHRDAPAQPAQCSRTGRWYAPDSRRMDRYCRPGCDGHNKNSPSKHSPPSTASPPKSTVSPLMYKKPVPFPPRDKLHPSALVKRAAVRRLSLTCECCILPKQTPFFLPALKISGIAAIDNGATPQKRRKKCPFPRHSIAGDPIPGTAFLSALNRQRSSRHTLS